MVSNTVLYTFVAILLCGIAVKFYFWMRTQGGIFYFIRSFFRWYGYRSFVMHTVNTKKVFMRASNIINLICWIASIFLILTLFFLNHLNLAGSTEGWIHKK